MYFKIFNNITNKNILKNIYNFKNLHGDKY